MSNHLGNVLATLSDRKLQVADGSLSLGHYFTGDLRSAQDYYAFGMLMTGRKVQEGGYRFGFQGQEQDDEVKGDGNSVNYKYRVHDPRLGRFLSIDPLTPEYPYNSPYAFSENRVIDGVELEGLERVSIQSAKFTNAPKNPKEGETARIRVNRNYADLAYHDGSTSFEPGWYSPSEYNGVLYSLGEQAGVEAWDMFNGANPEKGIDRALQAMNASQTGNFIDGFADEHLTTLIAGVLDDSRHHPDRGNLVSVPIIFDVLTLKPGFGILNRLGRLKLAQITSKNIAPVSVKALWSGAGTEAKAIAEGFLTLSQTKRGQLLYKMTKGLPHHPGSRSYNLWAALSRDYIMSLPKGSVVHVFLNNSKTISIFREIELPLLVKQGMKIVLHP